MYNGSEKHKKNLEKARIVAINKKVECKQCKKAFSSVGIHNHEKRCINGKHCPVCNVWFSSQGKTCSRGCANTYFRSGDQHPNWSESQYRTTCFINHEFKCCVCDENRIVEVHHFDENKKNNNPENLIPLCPTHHQYMHSRHKNLILHKVELYIKNWKMLKEKPVYENPLKRIRKRRHSRP